jgi:hypothetical protein
LRCAAATRQEFNSLIYRTKKLKYSDKYADFNQIFTKKRCFGRMSAMLPMAGRVILNG